MDRCDGHDTILHVMRVTMERLQQKSSENLIAGASHAKKWVGVRNHRTEEQQCHTHPSEDDTTQFITSPVLESPPHWRHLHRELLLIHRRGRQSGEKPELQRVMEQRRLGQRLEQQEALRTPTDLEQELRKRQQKLQEYEQEETKRRHGLENLPEFVKVKENLRHIRAPSP